MNIAATRNIHPVVQITDTDAVDPEAQVLVGFNLVETPRRSAALCGNCDGAEFVEDICADCYVRVYG